MRKTIELLIALSFIISVAACGIKEKEEEISPEEKAQADSIYAWTIADNTDTASFLEVKDAIAIFKDREWEIPDNLKLYKLESIVSQLNDKAVEARRDAMQELGKNLQQADEELRQEFVSEYDAKLFNLGFDVTSSGVTLILEHPIVCKELAEILNKDQEWFQVVLGSLGYRHLEIKDGFGQGWTWYLNFVMGQGYTESEMKMIEE